MKRMIAICLCSILLLSLCACGKSKEAQAVDDLILAIGEVSLESENAIENAESAYLALDEKDKKTVENIEILQKAEDELFSLQYGNCVERIKALNEGCDYVTSVVWNLWENVQYDSAPTETINDMFVSAIHAVLSFTNEKSLDELKESSSDDWWLVCVNAAACAFKKDYSIVDNVVGIHGMTIRETQEETINQVVDNCIHFCNTVSYVMDENDCLALDIIPVINKYKEKYQEEISILEQWYIDALLYADFTEGTPDFSSFQQQKEKYSESMKRYAKIADSYLYG